MCVCVCVCVHCVRVRVLCVCARACVSRPHEKQRGHVHLAHAHLSWLFVVRGRLLPGPGGVVIQCQLEPDQSTSAAHVCGDAATVPGSAAAPTDRSSVRSSLLTWGAPRLARGAGHDPELAALCSLVEEMWHEHRRQRRRAMGRPGREALFFPAGLHTARVGAPQAAGTDRLDLRE